MNCCSPDVQEAPSHQGSDTNEACFASREIGGGLRQTELSIPGIHCGGCVQRIERALGKLPGVERARVNLSTKRATISWRAGGKPPPFIAALAAIGFEGHLHDRDIADDDGLSSELLRATAVSGFAASNIMVLSVAIWSGAEPATRDLFHWISALIALPALAYSGRIFLRSAWQALRCRRTNMDVPISIGVLLAFGLSLYETVRGGEHAYFDASVSLLFFLLVGRTLDHMMRERARTAVKGLARLAARGALVLQPDGAQNYVPVDGIAKGMKVLLAAGERVPVDSRVLEGRSELDCSLVSGESVPQPVSAGSFLLAGTLNLTGPLIVVATETARESFLAEMVRMMEAAESGRSSYRRLSDRAARLYAPVVHLGALLTFIGWLIATGNIHLALTIAISVLIITCPCALGLAVPMVHVVAARRLFDSGVMVKDGGALERLAEVDNIVFDKTGTLTSGDPELVAAIDIDADLLALAATIASHSRHPYSRALAAAGSLRNCRRVALDSVTEHPGCGLEARIGMTVYRLGRPDWAAADCKQGNSAGTLSSAVLAADGTAIATFEFEDRLRRDAREAVAQLARSFALEVVSGDREQPVQALALRLGIRHTSGVSPAEKARHIASLAASGRKVLMVGDGLNDGPALVAAHASMAPASAVDVGRNAADLVFLRESFLAVPMAIRIARDAAQLVRQNLVMAAGYNLVAIPIAVMGHVTPLVAALAMSGSSLLVTANALRLQGFGAQRDERKHAKHLPVTSAAPLEGV